MAINVPWTFVGLLSKPLVSIRESIEPLSSWYRVASCGKWFQSRFSVYCTRKGSYLPHHGWGLILWPMSPWRLKNMSNILLIWVKLVLMLLREPFFVYYCRFLRHVWEIWRWWETYYSMCYQSPKNKEESTRIEMKLFLILG